jgi:hypothetical protein
MALPIVVEGSDGVGKSTVASYIESLLLKLGCSKLPSYSTYLLQSIDRDNDEILSSEQFYRAYIEDNPNGLYLIYFSEPSKEGVEGNARKMYLESSFSKMLGPLVYRYGYNYSRAVTYSTLFPAVKTVPNLIILADRSGLTTETMQPVDYLRRTLKLLVSRLGLNFSESELSNITNEVIKYLKAKDFEWIESIDSELAKLTVLPEVSSTLRRAVPQGLYLKLLEKGRVFWQREKDKLSALRLDISKSCEDYFGMKFPANFVIVDVPFPYEISRARGFARSLRGGILNFRDLDPRWVIEEIAHLYRVVPFDFDTNVWYLNNFCPIRQMKRKVLTLLVDILFDTDFRIVQKIRELGNPTKQYLKSKLREEVNVDEVKKEGTLPVDYEKRVGKLCHELDIAPVLLKGVEESVRFNRGDQVSNKILEFMGVASFSEGRSVMRKTWSNYGITTYYE